MLYRSFACLVLVLHLSSMAYSQKYLNTVEDLDLSRYAGKWHEIARLPNSFERDLTSVTATYQLLENGKIEVLNEGYRLNGMKKSIKGKAWVPKPEFPGRLKVRFFWPFAGNYYVIRIDESYKYALVGSPSRKFLWILSKEPIMPEDLYQEFLNTAREESFDLTELLLVDQSFNLDKNN